MMSSVCSGLKKSQSPFLSDHSVLWDGQNRLDHNLFLKTLMLGRRLNDLSKISQPVSDKQIFTLMASDQKPIRPFWKELVGFHPIRIGLVYSLLSNTVCLWNFPHTDLPAQNAPYSSPHDFLFIQNLTTRNLPTQVLPHLRLLCSFQP